MKDIKKVLIPNRGEIACRIFRTLDTMNIPGVIVYHSVDADTPAVLMADEKVEIQGVTPVSATLTWNRLSMPAKKQELTQSILDLVFWQKTLILPGGLNRKELSLSVLDRKLSK